MSDLWLIGSTAERNDSRLFFANGMSTYKYNIPGVICPSCRGWAFQEVIPIECPEAIQKEVSEAHRKQPSMPLEELWPLLQKWQSVVDESTSGYRLLPGMKFQPVSWEVPSFPEADYYKHIGSSIVSKRFKEIVEENQLKGLLFFPIDLKSVGSERPDGELPDEDEWESPFDLLKASPKLENPDEAGEFFNAITEFDSFLEFQVKDMEIINICEVCGHERLKEIPERRKRKEFNRENRFLPRNYIPEGYDFFKSHIFANKLVITPKAYEALSDCKLCNYEFQELTVVDE